MYVPNSLKLYGSNSDEVSGTLTYKYYFKRVIMKSTHLKSLDQPSEPCASRLVNPDTSECIAKYIDKKLGCNPLILGSHLKNLTCNTSSQWEKAIKLTKKFQEANAKQIYAMTGCLSSCEKNQHHKIEGSTTSKIKKDGRGGDLHLSFRVMEGSYEEREQYLIYDMDSFIADVGGFMGLLLGCSVLSLYTEVEAMLGRIKSRSFKK